MLEAKRLTIAAPACCYQGRRVTEVRDFMEMIKRLFQQPWFWPQDVREDPGFINRMGRVFHWTWVVISAPLLSVGAIAGTIWVWNVLILHEDEFSNNNYLETALWCLGSGVVTWMIGRGVRYVFSGE